MRICAGFIAVLICGFISHASAQGPEPKVNSNADDLAKIRGVLEEFRQDIIRKDGYAITKLVLNPNVLFHHQHQEEIDSARKLTLNPLALARASSMDLWISSLSRRTKSKRKFTTSRFARTVL
jgi:hypothetical protein